jgi:outer membrane receptor protein involved in Fe transport
MKNRYYYALGLCLLTISGHAKSDLTAKKDTLKTYNINEVIVTSSTKETNKLHLLPGSVTVLSPQTIATHQIDAIKDISSFVPNLYMPDYGSKLTSAIYIRGIGARSSGQSIGLYVDNIPSLNKSTFDFELTDIQRIEALRGPQGTLYGRNAMGGIINIYTLSPLDYQGSKISISGGNYRAMKAKASHYTKLGDKVGISLSGYYDRNDGFFTNEYDNTRADNEESAGGRFKLDYQINSKLKASYTFNYNYTDQGAFPYGMLNKETGVTAPIRINDPSSYSRKMLSNGLYFEYKTDQYILSSTTGYQHFKDDMQMDQDYTEKSIFVLNQKQKQSAWSEELAIKSNTNSKYQWSFGAYGFYEDLNTDGPVTFKEDGIKEVLQPVFDKLKEENPKMPTLTIKGDANNSIYFPGNFDTPTYGAALFHQSTYNDLFFEGFSVTAGLRLDYEKADLNYNSSVQDMAINVFMPPFRPGMPPISMDMPMDTALIGSESQDFLQLLPKLSLRYQCNPSTFTYVSVAKGYKTGGYNVQMFGDLVQSAAKYGLKDMMPPSMGDTFEKPLPVKDVASFKPEHSWNYEAGIRSELIKDRLSAELTAFYMDIRDIQLTQFVNSGSGRMISNAAKAQSYGVEASIRGKITEGLTADINYGFTHATFSDYNLGANKEGTVVDYKNNYVPYTPGHTLSVGVQYNKLFTNKFIDQFIVSAQFAGAGKIYWTEKNDIGQDFYGTLNGKVGVRKGNIKLDLWSRNITNTNYQAFYFESFGNSFIQKGKPLQIGAELSVAF